MDAIHHRKFLGFAGMVLGVLAALWPWFFTGDFMRNLEVATGALILIDGFLVFARPQRAGG